MIPELEKQIIGAVLLDNALFATAELHCVTPETFTAPEASAIYTAIAEELRQGGAADVVLIGGKLPEYILEIAECSASVVTTANFPQWVRKAKELEARRNIVSACHKAIDQAKEPGNSTKAILSEIDRVLQSARFAIKGKVLPTLHEAAKQVIFDLVDKPQKEIPLFPSGTEAASKIHVHKGELWILGAKTGSGKTELCAAGAIEQLRAGLNVAYFCTESATSEIMARLAAAVSGIPHYLPSRTAENVRRFGDALKWLADQEDRLRIVGNDAGAITPSMVRHTLRQMEETGPADVVYIDFIQNMRADSRQRTSLEEINSIVQSLHDTLAEYRSAGIVVCQFNRASQQNAAQGKGRAIPDLFWLRDTSNLEQLAHGVMFLHRREEDSILYSAKTRNCGGFCVSLQWEPGRYVSKPFAVRELPEDWTR